MYSGAPVLAKYQDYKNSVWTKSLQAGVQAPKGEEPSLPSCPLVYMVNVKGEATVMCQLQQRLLRAGSGCPDPLAAAWAVLMPQDFHQWEAHSPLLPSVQGLKTFCLFSSLLTLSTSLTQKQPVQHGHFPDCWMARPCFSCASLHWSCLVTNRDTEHCLNSPTGLITLAKGSLGQCEPPITLFPLSFIPELLAKGCFHLQPLISTCWSCVPGILQSPNSLASMHRIPLLQ